MDRRPGFTLLAVGLRIAGLPQSFYGDELFTYYEARQGDLGDVLAVIRTQQEITPPLFFFLAWAAGKLGEPLVTLRIVSVICSAATVPLLYLLGRRTVGWAAGVVAGGFWALSPMAIYYGIEARSYGLLSMLVVLAGLSVLIALSTRDWRWWSAVTLSYAASMYTHYTSALVLAAITIWALLTHRDQWRAILLSMTAAGLLFAAWIPSMFDDFAAPAQQVYNHFMPTTPRVVLEESVRAVTQGPYLPISLIPVVLVIIASAIAIVLLAKHRPPMSATTGLVITMALAAPVGVLIVSGIGNDMYAARNLTSSLPAIYLLLATMLMSLPRFWDVAGLFMAFAGLSVGAIRAMEPANQRPSFQGAADFIDSQAASDDLVVEVKTLSGPPSDALRIHLKPDQLYTRVSSPADIPNAVQRPGRYFVVLSYGSGTDVPGFEVVDSKTWPGILPLRVVVYETVP